MTYSTTEYIRSLVVGEIRTFWNRTLLGEVNKLWKNVVYRLAEQGGDMVQQMACPRLKTTVVRHAIHDENVEIEEPGAIDVHP